MLFSSLMSSSKTRWGVAAGVPAAMLLSLGVTALGAPAAAVPATPSVSAQSDDNGPTIVGVGDSYMSGEGVMYANHNFTGAKPSSSESNWQTGAGALGGNPGPNGDNTAVGNTWRSVFGDANGYPDTGGRESIPYCDRSYAAPMRVGEGWLSENLACSGATSVTVPKAPKTDYFKPGVDFYPQGVEDPPVEGLGQAQMLENLAKDNPDIKVVALSIGGNDFGFSDLGSNCITDNQLFSRCETKQATKDIVTNGLPKARAAVKRSITNITEAMDAAGYDQGDWRLVYQPPPLPIQRGDQTKYNDSGGPFTDRNSVGGCGLYNSTYNWIVDEVYPKLVNAMQQGVADSRGDLGETPITLLDTTKTFKDHGLCGKATIGQTNYAAGQAGKSPAFQDDNGRKTEWVTYVSRVEQLTGNGYQKSMPLHPNYWGQRALSSCMSLAMEAVGATGFSCNQDGERLDKEGRPAMKAVDAEALWVLAVGKPVITGSPEIGETLTADAVGAFEPSDVSYDYQWLRDGADIDGATNGTYVPTAGDLGKQITVRVTASKPGIDSDSAVSAPVVVSDMNNTVPPAVSGTPRVGNTLTADPGTYIPVPDSITYQWLADGEVIAGATGATLVVGPEKVGKQIRVVVTAAKAGYTSMVIGSAETTPVAAAAMTVAGKPTISGGTKPGSVLTASLAGVTFTPNAERVSYRWFRDGQLVKGVTGPDYEVTGDDVGAQITVIADGHAEGYEDVSTAASDPTDKIRKDAIQRLKDPKLKYFTQVQALRTVKNNRAKVGRDLQADLTGVFSVWPNTPKVKWYRQKGGKKTVLSDSDITYRPLGKDVGSRIWAEITTDEEGYEQASATTQKVTVVRASRVVYSAPIITYKGKKPRVGAPVKVRSKARFIPNASARYHWLADGKRIKGATGLTYRPTPNVAGKRLAVVAVAGGTTAFKASSVRSSATKPVKKTKGLG